METVIEHVTSADGTKIALHRTGAGRPLIVVNGASGDHSSWNAVVPLLADKREVRALDRRGRGASGDSPEYKPELEVDDIFAAAMGLHRDVDLIGQSSGAILSLRAAERGLPLRRLVLYEPPVLAMTRSNDPMTADAPERIHELAAAGDLEGALRLFMLAANPDNDFEALKASPRWPQILSLAHTVWYDASLVRDYFMDPKRLATIKAPVLLLKGSQSPAFLQEGVDKLASMLPDARVAVLQGQGHAAMLTAPALLAREVAAFLAE